MNNSTTWIWQTCRLIANTTRLALLQEIVRNPEYCVGVLADRVGRTSPAVSTQLRMLCDAGLITDHRRSQNVFYRLADDRAYLHILQLNQALQKSFSKEIPYQDIMRQATGCTHWRRIELLKLLPDTPIHIEELTKRTLMAPTALFRHMGKLEARGYVTVKGKLYSLGCPDGYVAKALLQIIMES